jgi:hypothetical protein
MCNTKTEGSGNRIIVTYSKKRKRVTPKHGRSGTYLSATHNSFNVVAGSEGKKGDTTVEGSKEVHATFTVSE